MHPLQVALALAFALTLFSGNLSAQEDWPMYGRNLLHTFSNTASRINPGKCGEAGAGLDILHHGCHQCVTDGR